MDGDSNMVAILITLFSLFLDIVFSDSRYMVRIPESSSLVIPVEFETQLTCEMSIEPDKFQWKFYPSNEPYNPRSSINLSNALYRLIPESKFTTQRVRSSLALQVKESIAGEYQCLAYYGAYVIASVPWHISISTLKEFPPHQKNISTRVTVGNTVIWKCPPPESNPAPYIEYKLNDKDITISNAQQPDKSLVLPDVTYRDSGIYSCSAYNTFNTVVSNSVMKLDVVRDAAAQKPYFIVEPEHIYTVVKGSTVFLECGAVGNPIPKVVWLKKGAVLPRNRTEIVPGGMIIRNITSWDDGLYICNYTNTHGTVSHHITLVYNEEPTINCLASNVEVKQDENLDLDCTVKGVPEPHISWFLNGFSVTNDSTIEAIGNRIYFRPIQKRHAGNLQIFVRNVVKTVNASISVTVIPISTTADMAVTPTQLQSHRHHKNRNGAKRPTKRAKFQMIQPSKPVISGLTDESVVVRWNLSNNGLPIQFFKVQYKEVGSANNTSHSRNSRWKTTNADIQSNIRDFDVTNLKTDHIYKFRIAAVYSNNQHKFSPVSDKFFLKRSDFDKRNPLPIPLITNTETVNATAVKIYWDCPKFKNVSMDGFYVNYISASTAGDYLKAAAEGSDTRIYILGHLMPETVYDVKIQSYNQKLASDFSPIMKARTAANPIVHTTPTMTTPLATTPNSDTSGVSKVYAVIAGGVFGFALVISSVVLLFVCRKWKQNKTAENGDKPTVEEHHIQADSGDYVVGQKSRSNGCVLPTNRITITSNPLADADNKNQTMIMEMRNLPAQNNNTTSRDSTNSAVVPEAISDNDNSTFKSDKYRKTPMKINNSGNNGPGVNYV